MRKKNVLLLLIFSSIVFILVFIIPFIYKFHSSGLSANSDDWGNLGSYIAGTIGVVLTVVSIGFITYTFYEQEKRTSHQIFNDVFFKLLEKHLILSKHFDNTSASLAIQREYKCSGSIDNAIEFLKSRRLQFEKKTERFYNSLFNRKINEIDLTNYDPAEDVIFKEEFVASLLNDIKLIIEFIEEEKDLTLSQRAVYHNILSNSLRESELFLFGAFICLIKQDRSYNLINNGYYINHFKKKLLFDDRELKHNPCRIFSGFFKNDRFENFISIIIKNFRDEKITFRVQKNNVKLLPPTFFNLAIGNTTEGETKSDGIIHLNNLIDKLFYGGILMEVLLNNVGEAGQLIETASQINPKPLNFNLQFKISEEDQEINYNLKLAVSLPANINSVLNLEFSIV